MTDAHAPQTDLLQDGWHSGQLMVNGFHQHFVTAGPADGRPVILLHGFPEFWWSWRNLIQPLADAGFRVIAPDMRGYNLSEAPAQIDAYQLDTLADDVAALASALGYEQFDLVAHDWGGIVAWRVAVRHADRLRRLVIAAAPHPDIAIREAVKHPTQALKSSYVAFFQLPWLPEATLSALNFMGLRRMVTGSAQPGTFSDEDMDRYAEAWGRPGRFTAMLNYYRAIRSRETGEPSRVATPVLVVWGGKDAALNVHMGEASVALCDDARLEVLDDVTHWIQHEAPDRLLELILGHLDGSR